MLTDNAGDALEQGKIEGGALTSTISDFYLTNPIARASTLMGELAAVAADRKNGKMAAE